MHSALHPLNTLNGTVVLFQNVVTDLQLCLFVIAFPSLALWLALSMFCNISIVILAAD